VNDVVEHLALGGVAVEFLQGGGIFSGDYLGLRVNAGFQGVRSGSFLAGIGARASTPLGVQAVGVELFESHRLDEEARIFPPNSRVAGRRGRSGRIGCTFVEKKGNIVGIRT